MTEVLLLGTGAADGWPSPFCRCASCETLRAEGVVRGQTAVLVDGTLLLDCGPEAPRAAERAGRCLADVRHVLLGHGHPDHTGPAALMWRSWARPVEPLDLIGPPEALDACRPWIGPADPVRLLAVRAGDRLALSSYDVTALAAYHGDGSVLYDIRAPDLRLLYATDTGPLPPGTIAACTGAAYDVVLLEETFGDATGHETGHLDLVTFPRQLAALREVGAVTDASDVVAVHLGHRNPPTAELVRRLAGWGARVVPDGTILGPRAPVSRPRRTLVLGGARSGKSAEAERRLAAEPEVLYLATGGQREGDPEWAARVAAHRIHRPRGWRTVETSDVAGVLGTATAPVLVDCLTLWLAGILDATDAWTGRLESARARVGELVDAWRRVPVPVVAVSNEVGSGVVPATPSGRLFRDELGRLNAALAAESEQVLLTVAGQVLCLRGADASSR